MKKIRNILSVFAIGFVFFFLAFDAQLRKQIEYWGIIRSIIAIFLIILFYNIDKSIKEQDEKREKK